VLAGGDHHRGRIVAQGSPESLREAWLGTSQLRVAVERRPG